MIPDFNRVVVFGTPRSGSNWICEILLPYFICKHPEMQFLGEYFNLPMLNQPHVFVNSNGGRIQQNVSLDEKNASVTTYKFSGGQISQVEEPFSGTVLTHGDMVREAEKRVAWLEKAEGSCWFKIHAYSLAYTGKLTEYIRSRCLVICIERRNIVDQILSSCLSHYSGIWAVQAPAKLPVFSRGQFHCEKTVFEGYCHGIEMYETHKKALNPFATVVYEDLLALPDPPSVLASLGFRDWPLYYKKYPNEILLQNPNRDYLKYFSNSGEMLGWLRDYLCKVGRQDLEKTGSMSVSAI